MRDKGRPLGHSGIEAMAKITTETMVKLSLMSAASKYEGEYECCLLIYTLGLQDSQSMRNQVRDLDNVEQALVVAVCYAERVDVTDTDEYRSAKKIVDTRETRRSALRI